MKIIGCLFVIFSMLLMSFGLPKGLGKKVDKNIEETFNIENFERHEVVISPIIKNTLPSHFDDKNFFRIISNAKEIGYAYIADAPSKTDQFTYLVLLDNDLIVKKSKVLVYREDYGGEIGSKRWLKQFIGKSSDDKLKYGDNIMAISGATISVKSMTAAVNNLLKSLKILSSKAVL